MLTLNVKLVDDLAAYNNCCGQTVGGGIMLNDFSSFIHSTFYLMTELKPALICSFDSNLSITAKDIILDHKKLT